MVKKFLWDLLVPVRFNGPASSFSHAHTKTAKEIVKEGSWDDIAVKTASQLTLKEAINSIETLTNDVIELKSRVELLERNSPDVPD